MLATFTTESNIHEGYFYSVTPSHLWWIAWLVFQGVTNAATSEPSLHLLSKLTVFSNVSLVDPSQAAGESSCLCAIFSVNIWKEGEVDIWIIDHAWGQDGLAWAKSYFYMFMDRDEGQYPAILTEQAWSIKDLLYQKRTFAGRGR